MMSRDFVGALLQLNAEKQVSQDALIRAVEEGIQAAYRRVAGEEDIFVRVEPDSGRDPRLPRPPRRGRGRGPDARGDGRGGAQDASPTPVPARCSRSSSSTRSTSAASAPRPPSRSSCSACARSSATRSSTSSPSREGELITGSVSRVEPRAIILDVGKGVEAILATSEQSPLEHYRIGQPVKAFVLEVRRSARGPQILVSRTHKGFLRRLFELEVPGDPRRHRRDQGDRPRGGQPLQGRRRVPPGGARPGRRHRRPARRARPGGRGGAGRREDRRHPVERGRVASSSPTRCRPRRCSASSIDEEHRIANVTVPERMLSLAIGREGQNARLAARLTGWRIDIRSDAAAPRPPEPRRLP